MEYFFALNYPIVIYDQFEITTNVRMLHVLLCIELRPTISLRFKGILFSETQAPIWKNIILEHEKHCSVKERKGECNYNYDQKSLE